MSLNKPVFFAWRKPILAGAVFLNVLSVSGPSAKAFVEVKLSSKDKIESARWLYSSGVDKFKVKGTTAVDVLLRVRQAQNLGQYKSCLDLLSSSAKKLQEVGAWALNAELECASKAVTQVKQIAELKKVLKKAESNPGWFVNQAASPSLRQNLWLVYFLGIELDLKSTRQNSAGFLQHLQAWQSQMDDKTRARLYRLMGDLAASEQKPEAARDAYLRSLREQEQSDVRSKLSNVLSILNKNSGGVAASSSTNGSASSSAGNLGATANGTSGNTNSADQALSAKRQINVDAETSASERELINRVQVSQKANDWVAAAEDTLRMIRDYPGSTRTKLAADKLIEFYASLIEKNDDKLLGVRDRLQKILEKADGERLTDWARVLHSRLFYEDSLRLTQKILSQNDSSSRNVKVLEMAAQAAFQLERYPQAQEYNQILIQQFAGTQAARDAHLRSAFADFHMGKFQQVVATLERYLQIPGTENMELIARYWLLRSLQKIKSDRAIAEADALIEKFPMSYYGLRLRAEKDGGILSWPKDQWNEGDVRASMWLTDYEKSVWARALVLIKAGWLEEAQAELRELPPANSPEQKLLKARVWGAALQYVNAYKLLSEAWDERGDLRKQPFVNLVVPQEFGEFIQTQADQRKIDRVLVASLIKQESAFNIKAVSTSNAMGLMQMIPPTAREIATDLKLGGLNLPDDMFRPAQNIQMGTYYLAKLFRKYNGYAPLAIASYNAGPSRMDRWLKARPEVAAQLTSPSTSYEDELWMDELPWSETCFYVKAILRNMLLYKTSEGQKVDLKKPIW